MEEGEKRLEKKGADTGSVVVFFGGFFRRAKQEDGGFWISRFRWSSCLGENTLGGGSAPVLPANAQTLSSQSSRTVRGCIAVAEVARSLQYREIYGLFQLIHFVGIN